MGMGLWKREGLRNRMENFCLWAKLRHHKSSKFPINWLESRPYVNGQSITKQTETHRFN